MYASFWFNYDGLWYPKLADDEEHCQTVAWAEPLPAMTSKMNEDAVARRQHWRVLVVNGMVKHWPKTHSNHHSRTLVRVFGPFENTKTDNIKLVMRAMALPMQIDDATIAGQQTALKKSAASKQYNKIWRWRWRRRAISHDE